jgi:hypothetical protein
VRGSSRVFAYLEEVEEEREREDEEYGDGLSPIQRARDEEDYEAIAEHDELVALIAERRATGGGRGGGGGR